jgi:hypothetical protein
MIARFRSSIAILVVALLAGGCAVTFTPDGSPAVDRPRPGQTAPTTDVGRGRPSPSLPGDAAFRRFEVGPSTIYPDTVLYFRFQVRQPGYLTVSAMAPNGRVRTLVRDVPVTNRPLVYPTGDSDPRIQASLPAGDWHVRAEWTPRPSGARYDDVQGLEAWTAAIAANLAGIPEASVIDDFYEVRTR